MRREQRHQEGNAQYLICPADIIPVDPTEQLAVVECAVRRLQQQGKDEPHRAEDFYAALELSLDRVAGEIADKMYEQYPSEDSPLSDSRWGFDWTRESKFCFDYLLFQIASGQFADLDGLDADSRAALWQVHAAQDFLPYCEATSCALPSLEDFAADVAAATLDGDLALDRRTELYD